jgi:hypothetical protein
VRAQRRVPIAGSAVATANAHSQEWLCYPLFFVSVASKGLSHSVSDLESIDRGLHVSVASKGLRVASPGIAIACFQLRQKPDFGGRGSFVLAGSEKPQGFALRYISVG